MANRTLFVYGTLMSNELLSLVLGSSDTAAPRLYHEQISYRDAFLYKFRASRVRARDYAGIIADPSSYVRGRLLGCLRDGDIENLDLYTGSQFERRKVKVKHYESVTSQGDISGSGSSTGGIERLAANWVDTETYVSVDPATLEKDSWDLEVFKKNRLEDFMRMISSSWSLPPSPAGRAGAATSQASSGQGPSGGRGLETGGDQGGRGVRGGPGPGPGASIGRGSGTTGGRGPEATIGRGGAPTASAGQRGQGLRGGWWSRLNPSSGQGASGSSDRSSTGARPAATGDSGPSAVAGVAGAEASSPRRCKACSKEPRGDEKLFRCARCRDATYCSIECQRADWREHKKTCPG